MQQLINQLKLYFRESGLSEETTIWVTSFMILCMIILFVIIVDFLSRKIILKSVTLFVKKTKISWDNILLKNKFFKRTAQLIPGILLYYLIKVLFVDSLKLAATIQSATLIYIIIIAALIIISIINSLSDIYYDLPNTKNRSIKGYIQIIKLFVYFVAIILIISEIFDKSPTGLLTGLGAMAAILVLVFKDTILGLVASIQLSANNMVQLGDWIEMPKYNADGEVIEMTLHTIKVQNWDKTITTIPTYSLISESFFNWRGMQESGGRRIKRSVSVDMKSVKFCDKKLLEKLQKIQLIQPYLDEKTKEIEEYNMTNNIDTSIPVNGRRLTNFGTFRKYIEAYLRNHSMIRQDMTFLIRHRQPTENGIPIEIYVFCKDIRWANYESIQADIFDHILAVLPEFELKVFQNPTGDDFRKIFE